MSTTFEQRNRDFALAQTETQMAYIAAESAVKRLEAENTKLRNLMQRRVKDYMYESCGDCWGGLCDECQCWVSECADELRELGIEVDD